MRLDVATSSTFLFNIVYFATVTCILAALLREPSYDEVGILISVTFLAALALMQSRLEDIVAFVVVYMRKMYGTGDLLKVGDVHGQITSMNIFGATLENHFTKMKVTIPHHMIYKQFTRI
jgi:small-conductance mechanosensitive channel